MRIIIVNKSDSTGGAAVVSFRLMTALRSIGVDAHMLVAEKLSDSPYVHLLASKWRLRLAFLADRLRIALANGFDRATLFKLDAAAFGIDISAHQLVRDADAVILGWINQGVISLRDLKRLNDGGEGRKLLWVMHDMWNMTGVCHHAGSCRRYEKPGRCGNCPMLGQHATENDLSRKIHDEKCRVYDRTMIDFVAVSSWLYDKAKGSTLLSERSLTHIPNPFDLPDFKTIKRLPAPGRLRIIFGAARIDDDIKGFPVFIEALNQLKHRWPELAERTEVILYGGIKDPSAIERILLPVEYTGLLRDAAEVSALYMRSDMVVSSSRFETLPGTLVEGQAYGCLPVAFDSGGQRDIIEDGVTGILVDRSGDDSMQASSLAAGIARGASLLAGDPEELRQRMYESVKSRFDAEAVAKAYISLIRGK